MPSTQSRLLPGLTAATFTAFHNDGTLEMEGVERQAAALLRNGVTSVFVNGSTGESHSLSLEERKVLTRRWCEVAKGTPLRVVAHVGSNCLVDARELAADAERAGVTAIAALAPSYFKPRTVGVLVDCMAQVAGGAPGTPFYFYDIPGLTGVSLSMTEFLGLAASRIPTLRGLKFTNPDLMAFQECLRADGRRWELLWGCDEILLAAASLGAEGAVGSTYNFAAPVYLRLLDHLRRGEMDAARSEQYRSVQMVRVLLDVGFLGAAKALMGMLGVPVGPPRLPWPPLETERVERLRGNLEAIGFFDWGRA